MGFDIEMLEPPTAAEARKAKLDADEAGYYRFNFAAMPPMVLAMTWAGAVVDEEPPDWPVWPPPGTPEDREEVVTTALYEPTLDHELTIAELWSVGTARIQRERVLTTPSKQPGKVPSFKFASNEGYVVTAAECAIIATKLSAFEKQLDAAKLAKLNEGYRAAQQQLVNTIGKPGARPALGHAGVDMSLAEYRAWIREWAAYNAVAARHRGYKIE